MKRVFKVFALITFAALMLTACSGGKPAFVDTGKNGSRTNDKVGFQFDPPKNGEEIAVLHTSLGDIKIRLFPKSAPIGVANFKALIKKGYYNGKVFHRAEKNFCIQGGSEKGDGTGGNDAWGGTFPYEYNANLRNFNGAVSYAHSTQPNSNTCQFFIITNTSVDEGVMNVLKTTMPADTSALYTEKGGMPHLDGPVPGGGADGYTVFGQVFEGMDIVTQIENGLVKPSPDATQQLLVDPIVITTAELVKYKK